MLAPEVPSRNTDAIDEDRRERTRIHFVVGGLLASPAKDTPECLDVWLRLKRNGFPLGSLSTVYSALDERERLQRTETSPTGKLLADDDEFDQSDPKHLEAIAQYKSLLLFQAEMTIKNELPGLPVAELEQLLLIRPTVGFRGGWIANPNEGPLLTLEELPLAYREP